MWSSGALQKTQSQPSALTLGTTRPSATARARRWLRLASVLTQF